MKKLQSWTTYIFFIFQPDFNLEISPENTTKHLVAQWHDHAKHSDLNSIFCCLNESVLNISVYFLEQFQRCSGGLCPKMFSTNFIFRKQVNLVDNQLCNKILLSCGMYLCASHFFLSLYQLHNLFWQDTYLVTAIEKKIQNAVHLKKDFVNASQFFVK